MIADRIIQKIDERKNFCVVGLDPRLELIPKQLKIGNSNKEAAESIRKFNFAIIDAIYDLVPAVKLQIAFYELFGSEGFQAYINTVKYAKSKGLIVIGDAKRNDIGSTSKAYAKAHLSKDGIDVDILTVNPYLGSDGLKPFIDVCKEEGKGIFVLVKTSNPSSGEFQDRMIGINSNEVNELNKLGVQTQMNRTFLYNLVGLQVNRFANENIGKNGYSSIGAVVGATYPEQAQGLRKVMPKSFILVPGYGAQGGKAKDIVDFVNDDGYGALVNSSRGIIFAYQETNDEENFAQSARDATKEMIKDINLALKEANKIPISWGKEK